ncbi:unnamed protein product [Linum tenue]|uniref:Uncharacterized protein n=1 Tax=Linum tenue TaxID=586396 RepID=A0AAV0HLK9_9ROSI|nr:unnamed protein product [Linum tenue]
MTGWQHLIHNVLGVRVPVKGSVDATDRLAPLRTNQVSITWLTKWIKNLHDPTKGGVPLTKESPEAVKERYARVYLIGMIGGVFFPKKANNLISCGWLKILLDRCLRQFGREQCIPLEVPESQKAFHHRDGRQGAEDWPLKLKKFITMWDNRQDFEIVTPTTVRRMGYHDPYMDIYRQQSVRYVTPEGAADGALVDGLEIAKNIVESANFIDAANTSFLRKHFKNLLYYQQYQTPLESVRPSSDVLTPPPMWTPMVTQVKRHLRAGRQEGRGRGQQGVRGRGRQGEDNEEGQ